MTRRILTTLLFLIATVPARADDPPSFTLTTDTLQYCVHLERQVAAYHSTQMEIIRLLAQGRDMCGRGQIRGGIKRLRRALVVLHHKTVNN